MENENKTMENKVEEPKKEVGLTRQQKIENFLLNPDKEIFNSLQDFNDSINYIRDLVGNLDLNDLEKIQGEDGKTPELGVDYLTEDDLDKIDAFIQDRVKEWWSSYPTVEELNASIDSKIASEVAKIEVNDGKDGNDGNDGKDGSPDTAEQILEKLRSLPKNKRINVSDIRGLQAELNRIAQDSETSIEELRNLVNSFQITIPAAEGGGGITDINGLIEEGANINITGSGTLADPFVINAVEMGLGDVVGPAGAVADNIPIFDGVTGKIIKDSGKKTTDFQPAGTYLDPTTGLKLDQSTPQTIVGREIHQDGIKFGTTPTVGVFEEGKMYYDVNNKTISAMIDTDITMQIGQEELVLVYNNTGVTIPNGKCVYPTGANGDMPTVALAKADNEITAKVLGMTTQDIPNGASGFVTNRGIVHNVDTSTFSVGQELYLSPTVAGEHTATAPTDPTQIVVRIGRVLIVNATTGSIYIRTIFNSRLTDLTDVTVVNPLVDQVLKWNGTEWINGPQTTSSAGAGVTFFLDDTTIIPAGAGPQTIPLYTLSKTPVISAEEIDTVTVNNNTLLIERYLFNTALGGTQIDGGIWTFNNYCSVNNTGGITTIPVSVRKVMAGAGTVTITGTGTSRTATVTGGTPFLAGDATADITLGGLLQTPNGCFKITGFTSSSVVTITTLSTYTNQSGVAYSNHRWLFTDSNTEVNNTVVGLVTSLSPQPAFAINPTDKLSISYFGRTDATANRNVSLYHNGSTNYTHFTTPLVVRHNDLAGLQGGTAGQYNHLTNAQLTVVQNTSGVNTGDSATPAETTSTIGNLINGATEKTTPVDADMFGLMDSAASNVLKKLSWVNVKETLKTYFDSLTTTLTNKRINPRLVTAASYTTDTGTSLNIANCDQFEVTAQAGALLFNAPGGTPLGGQKLIIRIKDNGTARALTYNAVFRAMGNALPSTTVLSKTLYMGFIYNATDTKWDLVAVAQEA